MRISMIVFVMVMASLARLSNGLAQTAADHAALAHGKPIVNAHPVQPTPKVVQERLRHHEMMLQSERRQPGSTSSAPASERQKDSKGLPDAQDGQSR